MHSRHGDRPGWNPWESHVTDTDFDGDDGRVLTAEGEVAAAICGHRIVKQRGASLTADMLDEFHGFVREELAALLEEKNAEIAYLRAIAKGKLADAAQTRHHHAGLKAARAAALADALGDLAGLVKRTWHAVAEAYRCWRSRERAARELYARDDRSLADLGINRADIPFILNSDRRTPRRAVQSHRRRQLRKDRSQP
jgi:uncharacterized protein YjiS (DUF1127 family)